MLSSIETQLGLTVIGPQGQPLMMLRTHPAFTAGRDLVRQSYPAEQLWHQLQTLLADPKRALVQWCERFGLRVTAAGEYLQVNDRTLALATWGALLQRMQAVGASPVLALRLADMLGDQAIAAPVGHLCLHKRDSALGLVDVGVVSLRNLPADAKVGDLVTAGSRGAHPYLVSHDGFSVANDSLDLESGFVIAKVTSQEWAADVLAQPAILGFNRTYRCEEGDVTGWLADMSFDSLIDARRNAREIQACGAEARIINRITGEPVPLV